MKLKWLSIVIMNLFVMSAFSQTDSLLVKIQNRMAATNSYESDCIYWNSFMGKLAINQKMIVVRNPNDKECGFYFRFFNDSIFPASADNLDFVIYNGDAYYASYKRQIKKTVKKDYPEKFVEINTTDKSGGIATKPSLLTSQFLYEVTLFQLEKSFNKCLTDTAIKRVFKQDTILHKSSSLHYSFKQGLRTFDYFFDKETLNLIKYIYTSGNPFGGSQKRMADFYNTRINNFIPLAYFAETNLLPNVKLDDSPRRKVESLKGKDVPIWTLPMLKSPDSLTLSQLKGKIILLEFTATWCLPCRYAVDMMENLKKKYANNKNVVMISAFLDKRENEENVLKMVKTQNQNSIAVYSAEKVWEQQYKQFAIPVFYIIDAQGKVVEQFNGYSYTLEEEIANKIDRLISR